jgi:hypothetical protein
VVEVDITHTDINKLELYTRLGVRELWRFNGQIWRIYQLENNVYQEIELSPTFPLVPKTKLYEFLATAKEDEVRAEKDLREWMVKEIAKNK